MPLTQQRLREVLQYDKDQGIFIWLKSPCGREGMIAGVIDCHGYRIIHIDKKKYRAGRLAFLYMTGSWPNKTVDHRDRDKTNDKWVNLRDVGQTDQNFNRKISRNNKSGITGIRRRAGKWLASIQVDGKQINFGRFDRLEDAIEARREGEKKYAMLRD